MKKPSLCVAYQDQHEPTICMGNSPSTGHGSEEAHVANMEIRNSGERPTEEHSKMDTKTKSDSNEDPVPNTPHNYTNRVRWANYTSSSCEFPMLYICRKL